LEIFRNEFYSALALAIILAILFAQMPKVYSVELTVQEKALSVISDVVGLDVTKYDVKLSHYSSGFPDDYGGLAGEDMTYTLESAGSKVDVNLRFVNKTLWFVHLYSYNGSLLLAHYAKQLPTNILDATKVILQRLHTYSRASHLEMIRDSMDTVSDINSVNATIGNLKRLVTVKTNVISPNATSTRTSIYFKYTMNGADSPKSVNIHFKNGVLTGFGDGWNIFTIGNESVNISKEEAINIAREQANNSTTTKLNFGNHSVRADLHLSPREPFTLYPFWFVELPLYYPNSTITGWQLGIWADTGEIEYSHPTGVHGTVPLTENPSESPTNPESTSTEPSSDTQSQPETDDNTCLVVMIVSIIAVVATAVVVKQKRTN